MEAKPKARSTLLPTVTASGGAGLNHFEDLQPRTDPKTGLTAASQDYDSTKASVTLSQPVVNLAAWAGLFQADEKVEEAQAAFVGETQELLLRVAEKYFKVLAEEESLLAARAEKVALQRSLARARRAVDLGMFPPTLLQKAQASLDMAVAEEIAAANRVANSLDELTELTGDQHESLARLPENLPLHSPQPAQQDHWMRLALDANPILKSKEHALQASRMDINRQLSGYLPTLNLTGSIAYSDTGGGRVPGEDNTSAVMLELRVPIFEGGATAAQVRESRALFRKSQQDYERVRRMVKKQVQVSFRGVIESKRRVEALRRAAASNMEYVRAAEEEVEVGVSTLVDLLEAVRDLYKTQRDLAQAKNEYLLHQLKLRQAAGILSEADIRQVDKILRPFRLPELMASNPVRLVSTPVLPQP